MHKGLLDGQIGTVRLHPPAIVVIVLAAVNHVIRRIDIHAVAIAILGGGPMTARTATAMHMVIAEGTALGGKVGVAIEGDPLIPDVRHLHVLNEAVARIDEQAVADAALTAINREVADGYV